VTFVCKCPHVQSLPVARLALLRPRGLSPRTSVGERLALSSTLASSAPFAAGKTRLVLIHGGTSRAYSASRRDVGVRVRGEIAPNAPCRSMARDSIYDVFPRETRKETRCHVIAEETLEVRYSLSLPSFDVTRLDSAPFPIYSEMLTNVIRRRG